MTRSNRTVVAALALALLTTTACGARWSDAQRAELASRTRGGGSSGATGPAAGAGATPGADGAATAAGSTGTGSSTGGSTTGGQAATGAATAAGGASGPAPCNAPSTAPGVSDSEITVGSISSLSGPVPGLGSSNAGAVRSYVAYRNATGGVCGRKVVLREADDNTDAGTYRSRITDMAPNVLGVVGGFGFGDTGGVDIIDQQQIPVVTTPSADSVSRSPNVFDINPPYENIDAAVGKYKFLYDQGVRNVSMVYIAVDQSRSEAQNHEHLMKAAGINIAQIQELPLSTLSFDSPARAAANSGADYLFFIGDAHSNVSMARAVADAGYKPKFAEYFTFSYGTDFISAAGSASEGAITWLRALPNEEASTNAEMATYTDWMAQIVPNEPLDAFAADGWAATKAFFDALEAVPGPITRDALEAQLRSIDTYDAGGMYGPIRFSAELSNACVVGMQVQSGEWRRLAPAGSGFLC